MPNPHPPIHSVPRNGLEPRNGDSHSVTNQPRADWAALYYDERSRHRETLINDSEIIEVLHSKLRHRTHQVYTLLAFWCLLLILFLNALLFVK